MQQLHDQYKFGKWTFGSGRVCGKDLQQDKDYSIFVSQQYYTEQKCRDRIPIPKGANNDDLCDQEQVQILREKSWILKLAFQRVQSGPSRRRLSFDASISMSQGLRLENMQRDTEGCILV